MSNTRMWQARTLELLIESRRTGETNFARAWRKATAKCRSEGIRRPLDYHVQPLQHDEGFLPFSSFWRHACEKEWYGLQTADFAGLGELMDEVRGAQGGMRVVPLG